MDVYTCVFTSNLWRLGGQGCEVKLTKWSEKAEGVGMPLDPIMRWLRKTYGIIQGFFTPGNLDKREVSDHATTSGAAKRP